MPQLQPDISELNSPGIVLDNVSLCLQSHKVFESLSISFAAQQCHCVLGRSGVGKSSLLNVLSGSAVIESGTARATNSKQLGDQIAYMFQDDGLLPWLTVLDNVQLGLRLRGEMSSHSDERARELLDAVDLQSWVDHYPRSLSGGMRQRVALARTLMEERAIILMDEPFSRLDAITRDELQVLACELLTNRTVVLVTHDPAEALRIGHTVTVLHSALPSKTTVIAPRSQPPRQQTDSEVLELTPTLWNALSADAARPVERL
ncbi:MAG: ABC transporter ATP-binding protein [Granulosicoccus sp.]